MTAFTSSPRQFTAAVAQGPGIVGRSDERATTVEQLERAQEELAAARRCIDEERSKLQSAIDCMEEAVIFSDPQGRVTAKNRAAQDLWAALCGPSGSLEKCHTKDAFTALATLFDRIVDMGDEQQVYTHPTFERRGHTFEATYSLVRTQDGEPKGLVMVARDITEQRAVEQRTMHEERMSVVGKLAAAVAHEINNPIGVISLYGQLARSQLPPDSSVREHLDTILRNADACRKIVGDLLALARTRKPQHGAVDLPALCGEVVQSLLPLAERAGIQLRMAESPGALEVEGDAGELRQAVLNVTLNAVEATEAGGVVTVGVSELRGHDAPGRVIEVRDTGSGIADDDLVHLFRPFFTTKATGTGLGLSIVKSIVDGHAGRIEVGSALGRGTVLRIFLPGPHQNEAWAREASSCTSARPAEACP